MVRGTACAGRSGQVVRMARSSAARGDVAPRRGGEREGGETRGSDLVLRFPVIIINLNFLRTQIMPV